jgi:hypothetical protein
MEQGFKPLVVAVRREFARVSADCVNRRPECRACVCCAGKGGKAVIDFNYRAALLLFWSE